MEKKDYLLKLMDVFLELISVCDELQPALETVIPEKQQLLNNELTKKEISEYIKGYEQGLLEVIDGADLYKNKHEFIKKYFALINKELPDFFERINKIIARVLKRKKIRTETEYYIFRQYVDQLEEQDVPKEILANYWEILDDFA